MHIYFPWLGKSLIVYSVTMWVHLNHGDTGLARFLSLLAARARWVLLEPQPWKCYQVLTSTASNHL